MARVLICGAEAQAASSLAAAYPHREMRLLTDQRVVDGWDLPNASFARATPENWGAQRKDGDVVVPLCPRWLPSEDWSLARTLAVASRAIGDDAVLGVRPEPGATGAWQVKGDRWHRPDAPMAGPRGDLAEVVDAHGCGLAYQERVSSSGTVMAMGRSGARGSSIGLLRVHEERFFRAVVLQAAESIEDPRILERSLAVLAALSHEGWFTLNWVLAAEGPRLTSIRPAPRAAFGTFLRGGIDLLAEPQGIACLRPGLRFVAQPHYSSYRPLDA